MKKIIVMLGLCMYVCVSDTSLVMALPCMTGEQEQAITEKLTAAQQYNLRDDIFYRVRKGATLKQIQADLDKLTIVEAVQGLLTDIIGFKNKDEIAEAVIKMLMNCKEENLGTFSSPKIGNATEESKIDALSYILGLAIRRNKNLQLIKLFIKNGAGTDYIDNDTIELYFLNNGTGEILEIPKIKKAFDKLPYLTYDFFENYFFHNNGTGEILKIAKIKESAEKHIGKLLKEASFWAFYDGPKIPKYVSILETLQQYFDLSKYRSWNDKITVAEALENYYKDQKTKTDAQK